jgi:hypothetical protein
MRKTNYTPFYFYNSFTYYGIKSRAFPAESESGAFLKMLDRVADGLVRPTEKATHKIMENPRSLVVLETLKAIKDPLVKHAFIMYRELFEGCSYYSFFLSWLVHLTTCDMFSHYTQGKIFPLLMDPNIFPSDYFSLFPKVSPDQHVTRFGWQQFRFRSFIYLLALREFGLPKKLHFISRIISSAKPGEMKQYFFDSLWEDGVSKASVRKMYVNKFADTKGAHAKEVPYSNFIKSFDKDMALRKINLEFLMRFFEVYYCVKLNSDSMDLIVCNHVGRSVQAVRYLHMLDWAYHKKLATIDIAACFTEYTSFLAAFQQKHPLLGQDVKPDLEREFNRTL